VRPIHIHDVASNPAHNRDRSGSCRWSNGGAAQRGMRGSYGNNDSFFCLDCSTSSASLRQVRAMSIRIDCILKFAARSAIRWHSTACCRHSTGVIIVALMTPPQRPCPNSRPIMKPESMCAWRFKITVARRQHCNLWRRSETDDFRRPPHISLSPPAQRANKRPPQVGGLHKITMECFLPPRPLLPARAQLLGYCLFSTLEMFVGLHEEKPRTLPIADRTCLL
jgi:hypothetical protein